MAVGLRAGDFSSRELIHAHLTRIAAVNPALNALPEVFAETALAAAADADRTRAAGDALGPLHGLPLSVKCNVDLAGHASHAGVPALTATLAEHDAPHLARLRAAGAIVLARGNMPDFGFRWHTDNALYGATRNPWNAALTPGGSSGGDAVAVATGMTPLGLGNDFGGSLRFPAACCGIAALRPSLGAVARAAPPTPIEPPLSFQMFSVHGPLARRVADLRLAFECMRGADADDPWSQQAPLLAASARRVAVCADPAGGAAVDGSIRAAIAQAAQALADAGYEIEQLPALPEHDAALATYTTLVAADVRHGMLEVVEKLAAADTARFVGDFMRMTPASRLDDYIEALARRNTIARSWNRLLARTPLVLTAVCTRATPAAGFDLAGVDALAGWMQAMAPSVLANLLGLPALALPVGARVADGPPASVQLLAARFDEAALFAAGACIERGAAAHWPHSPQESSA